MPHQCLNCGHVIERGSDEILKGCSQCGGKKFMFTSEPMSKERRESIKMRADEVRDKMLERADPELMKILKDKGITDLDGSKLEMDDSLGEDWVRYQPGKGEERVEIDEGTSKTGAEIVEPGPLKKRSAKDLIKEYDKEKEKKLPKKKEAKKVQKKHVSKGAVKKRTHSKKKIKTKVKDVDVINIVEQGVYEIDVEKLLDDSPIIIQKDGSYLLHLPSLFKDVKNKKN